MSACLESVTPPNYMILRDATEQAAVNIGVIWAETIITISAEISILWEVTSRSQKFICVSEECTT
jgi:hypothetical protein